MRIVARDFRNRCWIELACDDRLISSVRPVAASVAATGPVVTEGCPEDDWIAPAFWDIQVNGRWGHSFSSDDLTIDQVAAVVRAQGPLGTARLCPTLITASEPSLRHGLQTIAMACEAYPDVAARVLGIHLEGPFLSELEGYRGAHPPEFMRDPDWALFQRLQDAARGRIALVTLAPERAGSLDFIRHAVARGVVVALGHSAADAATIRAAVEAGASLSTHLGNGIASHLPRHPNPIWTQAACDELSASFIADGLHLDVATLRVLARAKGPTRTILITDASPLAGLPAGAYGDWAIENSGKIVVAGTPYLAGSNQALESGVQHLLEATGWSLAAVIDTVTVNPARVLGRPAPSLQIGDPASFVVFRRQDQGRFRLTGSCIDGVWASE
jgi:N-acetylglucosamine-6-phosphate deacetylase